jgi:hypothetical protein
MIIGVIGGKALPKEIADQIIERTCPAVGTGAAGWPDGGRRRRLVLEHDIGAA